MLSNDVIAMNMINGKYFAAHFARPVQRNYSVYFLETPLIMHCDLAHVCLVSSFATPDSKSVVILPESLKVQDIN